MSLEGISVGSRLKQVTICSICCRRMKLKQYWAVMAVNIRLTTRLCSPIRAISAIELLFAYLASASAPAKQKRQSLWPTLLGNLSDGVFCD